MTEYEDGLDPNLMNRTHPGWTPDKVRAVDTWRSAVETALGDDPNLVDGRVAYGEPAYYVYYAGVLPESLAPVIIAARVDGVAIVGVPMRFDTATLDAAAKTLHEALERAGIAYYSTSWGTPAGGRNSGLTIGAASMDDETRILAQAEQVAPGVPVVVEHSKGPLVLRDPHGKPRQRPRSG